MEIIWALATKTVPWMDHIPSSYDVVLKNPSRAGILYSCTDTQFRPQMSSQVRRRSDSQARAGFASAYAALRFVEKFPSAHERVGNFAKVFCYSSNISKRNLGLITRKHSGARFTERHRSIITTLGLPKNKEEVSASLTKDLGGGHIDCEFRKFEDILQEFYSKIKSLNKNIQVLVAVNNKNEAEHFSNEMIDFLIYPNMNLVMALSTLQENIIDITEENDDEVEL